MDNTRLFEKRRNRAIAVILGFKEDYCDSFLPEDVSQDLRKVILDEFNDVCNLAIDLMEEGVIFNQEFFDRIRLIDQES
jgi:hypothetical protein